MLVRTIIDRSLARLTSSDLLLIKSKLYNLEHGVLTMDKSREFGGTPVVKLGDHFKKVAVSTGRYIARQKNRRVDYGTSLMGRTSRSDSSPSPTLPSWTT